LEGMFGLFKDQGLLTPVRLTGAKGNPIPDLADLFQVDADRIRIVSNTGTWRCRSCRRRTPRKPPKGRCLAWRCDGDLEFVTEDPDDYNLQVLDQGYSMLKPEEHTAMVPHEARERLE